MAVISQLKKKSKNLFDYKIIPESSYITQIENGIRVTNSYLTYTGVTCEQFLEMTRLKQGDTATFSQVKTAISGTNSGVHGRWLFRSRNSETTSPLLVIDYSETSRTFTIPENFDSEHFYSLAVYGRADGIMEFTNIQIEKGEIATQYEPYYLDITKYNNATISNINFNGVDYHFAKNTENIGGYCDNAVEEPIIDMQIKGNSVQDGEPTPEAPVEVESFGDKTKNLFDKNSDYIYTSEKTMKVEQTETGFILTNTVNTTTWGCNVYPIGKVEDFANQTIFLSVNVKLNDVPSARILIGYADYDGTNRNMISGKSFALNGDYEVSMTVDAETYAGKLIVVWFYSYANENPNSIIGSCVEYSNIMVSVGKQEYEPYGYKIRINISGENFIKLPYENNSPATIGGITYTVQQDGSILCNGTATATSKFFLNTIIPADYKGFILDGGYEKGSSNSYWLGLNTAGNGDLGGGLVLTSSSTKPDRICIRVANGYTMNNVVIKPRLAKESPKTTNIYLTEPLRKIGDYADYIDYKNKKVVRNFKKVDLSILNWTVYLDTGFRCYLDNCKPSPINGLANILNSHYRLVIMSEWNNKKPNYTMALNDTTKPDLRIRNTDYENVEDFIQSLEGVYVIYELATPTEETIDIPEISTIKGTNIFNIETTIEPSEIKVNYWKQI